MGEERRVLVDLEGARTEEYELEPGMTGRGLIKELFGESDLDAYRISVNGVNIDPDRDLYEVAEDGARIEITKSMDRFTTQHRVETPVELAAN